MNNPSGKDPFDSQVQAYADGELTGEDRDEFNRSMGEDAGRREETRILQALKQAIRDAYPVSDRAAVSRHSGLRHGWLSLAASLIIGLVIGFAVAKVPTPNEVAAPVVADAGEAIMTRVLLHVGSGDRAAMGEALVSARYILDDFARTGRSVRVQVVANGPGLDIFRRSVSPFADTIDALERDYSNVQFVACQNTIDKVEERLKHPIVLLPEVLRVDSGVADIARKRARGWLYIGV